MSLIKLNEKYATNSFAKVNSDTFLNLIAPITIISSGDSYYNSLDGGGNTQGNTAAINNQDNDALTTDSMLDLMK